MRTTMEQISELPVKPQRLLSAATKQRQLIQTQQRVRPTSSHPYPQIKSQKMTLDNLEQRQSLWRDQLSLSKLQEQSNITLSNFELTNKKLRLLAGELTEQRKVDQLVNCNLSQRLLSELGIQQDVKFYKDTTLEQVTGAKPLKSESDREYNDWHETGLFRNLLESSEFNREKSPLVLSEEQIGYCINLLRYCGEQFENKEKLRQLFSFTIATSQYIYTELGLHA